MSDINQPTEAQVKSISPDSELQNALSETISIHSLAAGDYIYAKITRYRLPLATTWAALTRMWALLAAGWILAPLYPESEDTAERNEYERRVDAWIDAVNNPNSGTARDDAGSELPLALKSNASAPASSTENVIPMFFRPRHKRITGQLPELNQETAETGIVENEQEDNY